MLPAYPDGIKELLFDTLSWSDRKWSQQLGRACYALLYYLAEMQLASGYSFVIESNFDPSLATSELLRLKEKYDFTPFQIHCRAEGKVLFERFKARNEAGERHPGHVNHLAYEELKLTKQSGTSQILQLDGIVFDIDTTHFDTLDYADIFRTLNQALNDTAIE